MMRTNSNPMFSSILKSDTFNDETSLDQAKTSYLGISLKTFFLIALTIVSGIFVLIFFINYITNLETVSSTELSVFLGIFIGSIILATIAAIVGRLSVRLAMPCSIIYAILEGPLLVGLTFIADLAYPGIGMTAILVTLAIFIAMLILYLTGVIRGGTRLRRFLFSMITGWLFLYAITGILYLFGINYLFDLFFGYDSIISLLITFVMVIFAALSLSVDFNDATRVVEGGFDKKYEWSAAFGLLIGIIFLYIKVLRLLLIIAGRKR